MADHPITQEILDKAYSYADFNTLVERLFGEGNTTNGNVSGTYLEYTKLNLQRTQRIDKKGKLTTEALNAMAEVSEKLIWVVITEGWCGDSAQSLPYINLMATASENIDLKILLRDEYPEVMDAFLTNGSKSIPKLVMLDPKTLEVRGEWGPRPAVIQDIYLAERKDPEIGPAEASKNLHLWYARNKGVEVQKEISEILTQKLTATELA